MSQQQGTLGFVIEGEMPRALRQLLNAAARSRALGSWEGAYGTIGTRDHLRPQCGRVRIRPVAAVGPDGAMRWGFEVLEGQRYVVSIAMGVRDLHLEWYRVELFPPWARREAEDYAAERGWKMGLRQLDLVG